MIKKEKMFVRRLVTLKEPKFIVKNKKYQLNPKWPTLMRIQAEVLPIEEKRKDSCDIKLKKKVK